MTDTQPNIFRNELQYQTGSQLSWHRWKTHYTIITNNIEKLQIQLCRIGSKFSSRCWNLQQVYFYTRSVGAICIRTLEFVSLILEIRWIVIFNSKPRIGIFGHEKYLASFSRESIQTGRNVDTFYVSPSPYAYAYVWKDNIFSWLVLKSRIKGCLYF